MNALPFNIANIPPTYLLAITVWSLIWKGLALWRSAGQKQRNWFIVLLVVNTVGILEIVFLLFFAKERKTLDLKIFKI